MMRRIKRKTADPHAPEQLAIDFARGDRLAMLDRVSMHSRTVQDGRARVRVSAATQLSVLRAIESHAGKTGCCWASASTIGEETKRHERTVRRSIQALIDAEFLLVEKRPGAPHRYRINWGELSLRANLATSVTTSTRQASGAPVSTPAPQSNPGHFDGGSGHFDANPGHSVRRTVRTANEPLSPPTPSAPDSTRATWDAVRDALVGAGVIAFPKAIRHLQQAVTSQHAAAIVAHFANRPGAYGASALYFRCMSAHPDRPPNEGWPDPLPEWNLAAEVRYKVREEAAARREDIPEEAIQRKTVRLLVERGLGECLTPDERAVLERHPLFQETR